MQRYSLVVAILALVLAAMSWLRGPVVLTAAAQSKDRWTAVRQYPPLVFTSNATLDCSISSKAAGRQIMTTVSGQGFNFDAPMEPIVDGRVKLQGTGMHYEFNSFPTHPVTASFNGLGAGKITAMKTEVQVDIKRFSQPGGPGTNIHFTAVDMDPDGAYVEFTGVFVRDRDQKSFPFRVLFGRVGAGGGSVLPAGTGRSVPLMSKSVQLGTRSAAAPVVTALYEAEDDVPTLK